MGHFLDTAMFGSFVNAQLFAERKSRSVTKVKLTSSVLYYLRDADSVLDLLNTSFGQQADEWQASCVVQLVVDDDEYDIYMLDYADTCQDSWAIEYGILC